MKKDCKHISFEWDRELKEWVCQFCLKTEKEIKEKDKENKND